MWESIDWDKVKGWCWQAFKPALVAMIVALLTTLGYLGLQQSRGPTLMAAGTTHFTNLSVSEDASVGDDLTVSGDLQVAGAAVYSGGYSYSGQISAGNGLLVVNGISMTSGTAYFNAASVTTTLASKGQLSAENGFLAAGGMTVTSGTALVNALVVSNTASVGALASGDMFVAGTIYGGSSGEQVIFSQGQFTTTVTANTMEALAGITCTGPLLVNDGVATLAAVDVTSTATANTFQAADNVTVTHNLTVTGWAGLGGTYMAVSSTVDYTDSQTIVVVANKTIYPITSGGPTATLSATTSISDGYYLGQIIIVCNVDSVDSHLIVIKDNANTKIGGDLTLDVDGGSGNQAVWFWWDGSDWRPVSGA